MEDEHDKIIMTSTINIDGGSSMSVAPMIEMNDDDDHVVLDVARR